MTDTSSSTQASSLGGEIVCPLAKLDRLSPLSCSFNKVYLSKNLVTNDHRCYYQQSCPALDLNYSQNCVRYSVDNASCSNRLSSPSLQQLREKKTFYDIIDRCASPSSSTNLTGKNSPSCLDQGYHTLVSVSPPPTVWTADTDFEISVQKKNLSSSTHHDRFVDNTTTTTTTTNNNNNNRNVNNKTKKVNSNSNVPSSSCNSCTSSSIVAGNPFERLTDNLLIRILSFLSTDDLRNVSTVCQRFYNLAWHQSLWKIVCLKGDRVSGDKAIRCILRRLCSQEGAAGQVGIRQIYIYDGTKITDRALTLLSRRCSQLTHVHIQNCPQLTDTSVNELVTKCPNLQHLDLTGCILISCISTGVQGVEPPRKLCLQYIDLTDCLSVEDTGLHEILCNCPQLTYLYLRRCLKITDDGMKYVASFCCCLRELSVSDCTEVTDFALYELAKLGANLRYLSVAKCGRVSDAGLKVIVKRCYKLRYLNVRGCEAVSDDSLIVLARSCPRLRALDVGKCDVTDAGLKALAESCPNLKKLSLRNCDLITDKGVQYISYYCRGLQQLNIQDCQISVEGYRAVKKYCKRCIIEHTNPGFF